MKRTAVVTLLLLLLWNSGQYEAEAAEVEPLKLSEELKQLKDIVYQQGTTLVELKTDMKYMEEENAALKGRLSTAEADMEHVKKEVADNRKVAFSAELTSPKTPSEDTTDLIFSEVITNIGGGYNPKTGVFTAPARGVYYFRFTVCALDNGHYSGIYLYKNKQMLAFTSAYNSDGKDKFVSQGVSVQLEIGDTIHPTGYRLYHSGFGRNMFTGFMLFPN